MAVGSGSSLSAWALAALHSTRILGSPLGLPSGKGLRTFSMVTTWGRGAGGICWVQARGGIKQATVQRSIRSKCQQRPR